MKNLINTLKIDQMSKDFSLDSKMPKGTILKDKQGRVIFHKFDTGTRTLSPRTQEQIDAIRNVW
jgi:predicted transcriptional regulator